MRDHTVAIRIRLYPGVDDDLIRWWESLPDRRRSSEVRQILRRFLAGGLAPATAPDPGSPLNGVPPAHRDDRQAAPRTPVPEADPVLDTLFSKLEAGLPDDEEDPWQA